MAIYQRRTCSRLEREGLCNMIQEVIRSNIESKLNNNTQNLVFVVGSYAYLDNSESNYKDFIYNVRNGYRQIETDYIPVMMEFIADYEPIPNQINGMATINLTFLVQSETLEQANFNLKLSAMNELVSKVVGNSEDLVDGSDTYHSVWNMNAIVVAGSTQPLNGKYYTQFQTTVYIDFSDTIHYSNEYNNISLDGHTLIVIDGNETRDNQEIYPHVYGTKEAKGSNETSSWNASITVLVDDWVETNILNKISSETYDMNETFTFAETLGGAHTFDVFLKEIRRPVVYGEKQIVSFVMLKTDIE